MQDRQRETARCRRDVARRVRRAALLCALVAPPLGPALAFAQIPAPELPRVWLDTAPKAPTGSTIAVPAGGDFQAALDAAQPGDVITLQAGATYTGNYTLPNKSGTGWITIRTSASDVTLPSPGTRVTPADAAVLPKVVTPNSGAAIATVDGAHHYRLVGLEITFAAGVTSHTGIGGLVQLGSWPAQTTLAQVPHDIILDRVYVHGRSSVPLRRCIALNSASTAIIDSHVSDAHHQLYDAQAIAGWNGPGPYKIVNNYLEGSGENLMFGGADPSIPDLVPSDLEIRHNHVFKPRSWRVGDPSYAGIHWAVKDLLELKNAQRVLIDGNLFENNWYDAQNGFAIMFTVRNQDGQSPWSIVRDVSFTHNIVRHSAAGLNAHGWDDLHPSQLTERVLIADNVFEDVGAAWGGNGRLFQMVRGTADVVLDHNTGFQDGDLLGAAGAPSTGFVYRNTIAPNNRYGVESGGVPGLNDPVLTDPLLVLATYFPGAIFTRNAIAGGSPSRYPPDNVFPATLGDVIFVDLTGGDYTLGLASPYRNAGTDGKDLGADIEALTGATAGVSGGAVPDPVAPRVVLTAPAAGATVSGTITLTAESSDDVGVASIQFTLDGAPLGPALTLPPYAASWDTSTAAAGPRVLRAVARDAAGNIAASAVTITVGSGDSAAPVISAVTVSGVTASSATVSWITDEASSSRVEYGPTAAYGSVASSAPLVTAHVQGISGLSAGTLYHYRVVSQDAAGNLAASDDSTFMTLPPVSVTITTPAAGATISGKITVSATAAATAGLASVQFRLDGTALGGNDTSAPYSIRWDTRHSANGTHTLTAVAVDRAGHTVTSAPVTVTVKNGR